MLAYRNALLAQGLASATVNRRLAALRSCIKLARLVGYVAWTIDVPGLRVEPLRDARGPGTDAVARMLAQATLTRDRAIVALLSDLALRRVEVTRLDLADVDLVGRRLAVLGKGRTGKVWLTLPRETADALAAWLVDRGDAPGALFLARDHAHRGARLSGTSVYRLVVALGDRVGAHARPHGLRHAAITEGLEQTGGDVRATAKFSRHEDVRHVQRYDDARRDLAGQVAALVARRLRRAV